MLKRDILQEAIIHQQSANLSERATKNQKKTLTFWNKLQNGYFAIFIITSLIILLAFVLQLFFYNKIVHLCFCALIAGLSLLLYFIARKKGEKSKTSHVFWTILWSLNFIFTLIR